MFEQRGIQTEYKWNTLLEPIGGGMEDQKEKEVERDVKGRFKHGHQFSRKHLLNKRELRAIANDGELETIVRGFIDRALNGDIQAAEWVASRMIPALKPESAPRVFDMDTTDLTSAVQSIIHAVANGNISVDQGKTLVETLKGGSEISQLQMLGQRVAELAAKIEAKHTPVLLEFPTLTEDPDSDSKDSGRKDGRKDSGRKVPVPDSKDSGRKDGRKVPDRLLDRTGTQTEKSLESWRDHIIKDV